MLPKYLSSFIAIPCGKYSPSNTTNLLYQNWSGLWVESEKKYIEDIKKNLTSLDNEKIGAEFYNFIK